MGDGVSNVSRSSAALSRLSPLGTFSHNSDLADLVSAKDDAFGVSAEELHCEYRRWSCVSDAAGLHTDLSQKQNDTHPDSSKVKEKQRVHRRKDTLVRM